MMFERLFIVLRRPTVEPQDLTGGHMRAHFVARAFTLVLIVAGTTIIAAPSQTAQPGQMTQARVWVQNRGRSEAVPVEVREVNLDAPLKVNIINGESQYPQANPVAVREIRKTWEYETITLATTDDVAAVLNKQGQTGWETTGIAFVKADGTTLLLKRPR
jgi:hypothetical protein